MSKKKRNLSWILLAIFVLAIPLSVLLIRAQRSESQGYSTPVRIGFFDNRGAALLYRTYMNHHFDDEEVTVVMYTKFMFKDEFCEVPKSYREMENMERFKGGARIFGRISGREICEGIGEGVLDGGIVGGASFVDCITEGVPLVAVMVVSHDDHAMPSRGIVLRNDVVIEAPDDFRGKTLLTRRGGPIDSVLLREFIERIGLDLQKDITIIDQVPDHEAKKLLRKKKVDGGLYHVGTVRKMVSGGFGYLYRKMDWLNPEICQNLLVFRKDFFDAHPQKVKRIVSAYMKRIVLEANTPEEKDTSGKGRLLRRTFEFQGLRMPQPDYPPLVKIDLLNEAQGLLLKHKIIGKSVDLREFIDNRFVQEAYEENK